VTVGDQYNPSIAEGIVEVDLILGGIQQKSLPSQAHSELHMIQQKQGKQYQPCFKLRRGNFNSQSTGYPGS
jgi:hypothetical protein